MSESNAHARPSQVTLAGWAALVGSALLVLTLFDSMSQIRSIEMRKSIDDFLATSAGGGLGLDASQVLEIMRVVLLFAGAAAAAATVLAFFVLQRNQGARIGFTVAAAAIMFTAPVTGSPFAVIVAAAAMMMWTRPARDWFAGRAAAPTPQERKGTLMSSENPPPEDPPSPDPSADHPAPPSTEGFGSPAPPPTEGFGGPAPTYPAPDAGQQPAPSGQPNPPAQNPPAQNQSWPPPAYAQQPHPQQQGQPQGQPYGGYPPYAQPVNPDTRPVTVTIAAWLTWGFSALTVAGFVVVVLVMLAARDRFVDEMQTRPEFQELNASANDVLAVLWVFSAICLFWCVAAFVLAILAYRRVNWARITLVVSAAIAAIVGVFAFPVGLFHMLAAGATIALLFTGGANEWYSRTRGGQPSYPQQYPPQYPPYGGNPYGDPSGQPPYGQPGQPGQPPYGQPGGQYGDPPEGGGQSTGQGQPESGDRQDPPKNVW